MEIKYEAVFGDQSLFNGMPDNAILAVCDNELKTYYEDDQSNRSGVIRISGGYARIAMRRIICTPVWTKEDQDVGRLPEIGCEVINTDHSISLYVLYKVIYVDDEVVIVYNGELLQTYSHKAFFEVFKPIESPKEKAARLRSEWCNRAMDYSTIQQLYNAMLSGELPMPGKE